jgi:hypothetical protein
MKTRQPLTPAPESLEEPQRAQIRAWAARKYPYLRQKALRDEWEKCRDWHLSRGILRASWPATFRNWLRTAERLSRRDAPFDRDELQPLLRLIETKR